MGQVEEMEVAKICELSGLELKDFWCKHFKDEENNELSQVSYNVSSETEECFIDSYGNSSLEISDQER